MSIEHSEGNIRFLVPGRVGGEAPQRPGQGLPYRLVGSGRLPQPALSGERRRHARGGGGGVARASERAQLEGSSGAPGLWGA